MKELDKEPRDMTPADVNDRVDEILNDNIMSLETDNITLLDILIDIRDTEDITVVNALKNKIVSSFEETILYRLQFCKPVE